MSKYSIREAQSEDIEEWNSIVDRSDQGSLFHKFEWLQASEKESNTKFHPLVCVKSEQDIVCLLPVFFEKKALFRIIHSPPPGCAIPSLGPVFNHSSNKQNKIESERNNVIETFDEYLSQNFKPDYIRIITELEDVRPFKWGNYLANPLYTYRLDLEIGEKEIFKNFDKSIRSRVRKVEKLENNVDIIDCEVDELVNDLNKRYDQKGRTFKVDSSYLRTITKYLNDENIKIQALQVGDKKVSIFAKLLYNGGMKFWLGGANLEKLPDGGNEFIHWNNIKSAISKGCDYYERIGANTKHLCENKSKYGFSPKVYYTLEKMSNRGKIGLSVYNKLKG